jgi:hypothetical protein
MCVGLIKDIPTCKELLDTMEKEAEEVVAGLAKMIGSQPKAKL